MSTAGRESPSGYDSDYLITHEFPYDQNMAALFCFAALLPNPNVAPDTALLDVGCGAGRHAIPLATRFPQGSVTGLDNSRELLAVAASRKAGQGVHNVQFVRGDMCNIPCPDNSFDAVLNAFGSWGFWDDKTNHYALNEMVRVLRPGGTFVFDYGNVISSLQQLAEIPGQPDSAPWEIYEVIPDKFSRSPIVRHFAIDPRTYRASWEYFVNGHNRPLSEGSQQGYTAAKLMGMLGTSLYDVRTYGDYDLSEFNQDSSRRIILKGRKATRLP